MRSDNCRSAVAPHSSVPRRQHHVQRDGERHPQEDAQSTVRPEKEGWEDREEEGVINSWKGATGPSLTTL